MTRRAFQFFLENAGYCTPPGRTQCAANLARAEEKLHEALASGSVRIEWEWDNDFDDSWMDEAERALPHEWTLCAIIATDSCQTCGKRKDYCLASLHGIVDADANYRRVIEAELALEAFPEPKGI